MLSPPFEPDVHEYDLDLVLDEAAVAFTPTAAVPTTVEIQVDGEAAASGTASRTFALSPGSREVVIALTAAGGASASYVVHAHRGVDALASLEPSSGSLDPAFDPGTRSYSLEVVTATSTVTFTPTLLAPGRATVTVDGVEVVSGSASQAVTLPVGANTSATVVVTPTTRPGQSTSLVIHRGNPTIDLTHEGFRIDRLVPEFDPGTTTYSVDVGLWMESLEVTVNPIEAGSTITINGSPAIAGAPTAPISLNLGATSIAIVVTPPAGTPQTYTVNVTRGSGVLQEAYGKAPIATQAFGTSVALWGDTLAVTALLEGGLASGEGAVYVFTRVGTTWSQQAHLKASNAEGWDMFGVSVALWGDTLAVGAVNEDSAATGVDGDQADNGAEDSGAVYVFTRTGTTWSQQAYVKASNTQAGDTFGVSVAVWEHTLAVGAYYESSNATGINGVQTDDSAGESGAVYVFARTGTTWSQQAYIKASNTQADDHFGYSVALCGDTLAVGAWDEDSTATGVDGDQANNSAVQSGAAYVYARSGTNWTQQAYLKASNTQAQSRFGFDVALASNTLAVGANNEGGSGAAYTFIRTGTIWSQQAYLKASNAETADGFGTSIALWDNTLAVGASSEDSAAIGVDGNQADNSASASGAVYSFTRSGTTWSQQAYFKASNTEADDQFGTSNFFAGGSLALWGDTLAVGTPGRG